MSTILKALQRLEREHRDEPDRSLRDEVMKSPSAGEPGSRSRLLPVLIGLVLGATVGGTLIWFLATPAPKIGSKGGLIHADGIGGSEAIEEVAPVAPVQASPARLPPTPVSEPPGPVPPVRSTPSLKLVIPAKPATAPREVGTSREMAEPAQDIRVRLPAPLPQLLVRKTVWHPVASRRVAYLSIPPGGPQQEVHEGDFLGSLVVLEIAPSSVVFGRDGVQLRKRVGE